MPDNKKIIDLKAEKTEEGEIFYTQQAPPSHPAFDWRGWTFKIVSLAFGIAVFLFLLTFFIYVVIPLILIIILWNFIRKLFNCS